jgi:hypothetical protein
MEVEQDEIRRKYRDAIGDVGGVGDAVDLLVPCSRQELLQQPDVRLHVVHHEDARIRG